MAGDESSCTHAEGHCDHWYDGNDCCRCGELGMTREEMVFQGMIEDTDEEWQRVLDERAAIIWPTEEANRG